MNQCENKLFILGLRANRVSLTLAGNRRTWGNQSETETAL